MLVIAFRCSFLFVLVLGACFHLLFIAFCCSSLLVLVFDLKTQNRQMPLVTRFGFLLLILVFCRCFHLNIPFARFGFLLVRKIKTGNKGAEKSPNGNQA